MHVISNKIFKIFKASLSPELFFENSRVLENRINLDFRGKEKLYIYIKATIHKNIPQNLLKEWLQKKLIENPPWTASPTTNLDLT